MKQNIINKKYLENLFRSNKKIIISKTYLEECYGECNYIELLKKLHPQSNGMVWEYLNELDLFIYR
jgi:hypothetical protein